MPTCSARSPAPTGEPATTAAPSSTYKRAMALAPGDPDLVEGYEATVRAYGSSIAVEGFAEGGVSDARSASLTASVRVLPRLEIEGRARVQNRNGSSDTLGGGGGIWRVNRSTNLAIRGVGGVGNTSLPNGDVMAEVRHYRGAIELGGIVRHLSFSDVGVTAASPLLAWDTGERWRLATRYTYSWSSFHATGESSGDHSVLLRETFRAWRRVDMTATYAYGIESFEDLTADRIGNLGANTVAATLQFRLPSLTTVATTWERQWRSNDTTARPADRRDHAGVSMTGLLVEFAAPCRPSWSGLRSSSQSRWSRPSSWSARHTAYSRLRSRQLTRALPSARPACARGGRDSTTGAFGKPRATPDRYRVVADRAVHRGPRPEANRRGSCDRAVDVAAPACRALPAEPAVVAARARASGARARSSQGPHRSDHRRARRYS